MRKIKSTGLYIDETSIIAENNNGITIKKQNNSWAFIPKSDVEIIEDKTDKFFLKEKFDRVPNQKEVYNFFDSNVIEDENLTECFEYIFGLNDIEINTKKFDESCALISNNITLFNCSYISIYADYNENVNGAIEISILDGTEEIPILPENKTIVENEKLFYGLPTRFLNNEYKIYEDMIVTNKKLEEISKEEYENHNYSITYLPAGEIHKYFPKNDSIKIKVILRSYEKNYKTSISNIMLKKYGGAKEWQ